MPEPVDPLQLGLDAFPVRERGAHLGKFTVGQIYRHHWGRTITAGDNTLFSTATCNWNPMNLNVEFAVAHGHEDVVVNPMLILCVVIGLSVEDLSESGGPFLGVDDCQFPTVVRPGDTVIAESEVLAVRKSKSRPGTGIVTWRTTGQNQRGQVVCRYTRSNLIADKADQ